MTRRGPDAVGVAQGLFYAATGAWPIVAADSLQAVTGPRTDVWPVKTVGARVAAAGGALAYAGARGRTTPEPAQAAARGAALRGGRDGRNDDGSGGRTGSGRLQALEPSLAGAAQ